MVNFTSLLAVATVAVQGLREGDYYRPTGAEVSGQVGATTPFVRSPCPGLNTLANHGLLPRDGKNITRAMFVEALMKGFNIGEDVATRQVKANAPPIASLSDLSEHNGVEHDASLTRVDSYYEVDPATLDVELWHDLVGRAKDGKFGVKELAGARKDRMELCESKPTGCSFGPRQRLLSFGEATLFLRAFGGANNESCPVEFARSFFVDERFPDGYTKPEKPISIMDMLVTAAKIQVLEPFQ